MPEKESMGSDDSERTEELVDSPAVPPDLTLQVTGLHVDAGHLHHGGLEPVLPPPGDVGVVRHHLGRGRRREQRRVGREEHPVREHVLVVLVVQRVGRHGVLHHGGVAAGRRALAPQRRSEGGVDVGGRGETVGDEGGAVGAADGVRAGERDHVLDAEALGGEALDELGEAEGGRREEAERARGAGDTAVEAAGGHVEVVEAGGAAEEGGGVAGGEGDDVGAGDGARARPLDRGLGGVDDLEAPEAGVVGRGELLRLRVGRRRVEEDGGVAALDEAVVEEHADEACADAGVETDGVPDDASDDGLGGRALAAVVPHLEPLIAGCLHLDLGHLDEGLLEPALPPPWDIGIMLHHLGRRRRGQQRGVGREEHPVREHVLVVLVVERVRGGDVLVHGGVGGGRCRAGTGRAPPPERGGERSADVGGGGEAVGDEGGAVGAADGVRAREYDHVLDVQPLGGEAADEPGDVGEGRGQVAQGLGGAGDAPVEAAGGHVDLQAEPAEEVGGVAGREGDDVGAGDLPRAGLLDGVLGRVDDLEAAQAGEVGRAQLLRPRVRRRRVQEHRAVASLYTSCRWWCIHPWRTPYLDEAVVEEQADEAGADAGVLVDELLHLVPDDVLRAGARLLVVAHLQLALARRRRQSQADPCHRHGEPERSSHCCLLG
ncbi:hypothetical protein U9M48_007505 [Paspalum notatum var. saurae]|uniref:Uncharacterized protein n=1 Tax=Paspalum notatum var. saurae TaxID=547442 RepID=A0AAQ3PWV6_PASNO